MEFEFQLNLGNNGNVGTYSISPSGTYALKNGSMYPIQEMGTYSISIHDVSAQKMSGYFQIRFLRQIQTTPIVFDTLELTSGQFEEMPY